MSKPSRNTRSKKISRYTALANEHPTNTPDWHFWMQYVEHWRRVYQIKF